MCSTPEQRIIPLSKLALATARPTLDLQPDLQNGYALLNKGWFYIVPDSSLNPFYAHIDNGTLLLKLPEGKEKRDFWVYNPKLNLKNFVLSFDFQFEETQPDDTVRFQFRSDRRSKRGSWTYPRIKPGRSTGVRMLTGNPSREHLTIFPLNV